MARASIHGLGTVARWLRRAGLGAVFGIVRDALDTVFVLLRRPPLAVRVEGMELRGFLRHRSFLASLDRGVHERQAELFASACTPGATVVDIGAHIGEYTLRAASLVGPEGHVVAFEPDPYNFSALVWNASRLHPNTVRLVRKAVSDHVGPARFNTSPGTIGGSLVDRPDAGRFRPIEIDATTVDHELADLPGGPLVVKLDVEGAELAALDGMRGSVERFDPVHLFAEVNPSALQHAGTSAAALVARAESLGLDVRYIDEETGVLMPIVEPADLPKGNIYCSKAGDA